MSTSSNKLQTRRAPSPIYLEHNGQPVNAAELVWLHIAACGCLAGVQTVDRGDGDVLTTAEVAASDMRQGINALVERDREDGFTYRLATWPEYKALSMGCEHDPKWGVPVVTVPDGHSWATTDRWYRGRRSHKKHIVPNPGEWEHSAALCGYAPPRHLSSWSVDRDDLSDTVTCRKCETAVTR